MTAPDVTNELVAEEQGDIEDSPYNIILIYGGTFVFGMIVASLLLRCMTHIQEKTTPSPDATISEKLNNKKPFLHNQLVNLENQSKNHSFPKNKYASSLDDNDDDDTDAIDDDIDSDEYDDASTSASAGLVSKMKQAQIREIEARLTSEQLEEEKRIQQEQLNAIYSLLKQQEAEFRIPELSPEELQSQLNLYR